MRKQLEEAKKLRAKMKREVNSAQIIRVADL